MLGKMHSLMDVTWDNLLAALPLPELQKAFAATGLLAATNWTMLPFATELWQSILAHALPEGRQEKMVAFFDLADPEKRTVEDLRAALRTIEEFNRRCRAILGLNRKEAAQVAAALGLKLGGAETEAPLAEITQAIAGRLAVHGVVVHPTTQAACVVAGEFAQIDGPYTSRPKLTTGAGDNFNAGFCLGLVCGLSPAAALASGTGNSGFYVRNGRSASFAELLAFLDIWHAHAGQEF